MTTSTFLGSVNATEIYRGITANLRLTVTQDGAAYDLTDAEVYFTVKCNVGTVDNKLQKTVTNGGVALADDPRDGTADITLSAADTQSLDPGSYVYDIVIVKTDERYLVVGPTTLVVKQSVTRF
jgi:hypothetical protein